MQLVGTDHCVFNSTQKAYGKNDFRKIPNGVNGYLLTHKLLVLLSSRRKYAIMLMANIQNYNHHKMQMTVVN